MVFSNYKHIHYLALADFIFIILICLSSCTKSPMISPQHSEILKHYERITVYKGSGRVKTSFEVNVGDYILLLASGQLKLGQRETPIENFLFMEIGNNRDAVRAVNPPNYRRSFFTKESGKLIFYLKSKYEDKIGWGELSIFGSITVDIFVFSDFNGQQILRTLHEVLEANKNDETLYQQLNHLISDPNLLPENSDETESKNALYKTRRSRDHQILSKWMHQDNQKKSVHQKFTAGWTYFKCKMRCI